MIVRTWRGAVRAEDADAYLEYLRRTGLAEYAGTPGHVGTLGLRRTSGATTEYLLLTAWSSPEAVRAFAGDHPERAVFYPEDRRYLVEADEKADHFEPFFVEGALQAPEAAPADHHRGMPLPAAQGSHGVSRAVAVQPGRWGRGWIAYAAAVARRRATGVDFR